MDDAQMHERFWPEAIRCSEYCITEFRVIAHRTIIDYLIGLMIVF